MTTEANHAGAGDGNRSYLWSICLVATLGGLLFGYDTAVISGGIGFLKQHFALNDWQEGWAASSALLGCVIGVSVAGELSDRMGRRTSLMIAALAARQARLPGPPPG